MNYLLGTGRYNVKPEWEYIWNRNLPDIDPSSFMKLEVGLPAYEGYWEPEMNAVYLSGNLGHVHDLLDGKKPHQFCGWSAAVMALAMTAYCNETDFIYKEQDCLAFGPWVAQMYKDLGDGQMIFGAKMKGPPWMQCGQSLFLIKHAFIPEFVKAYIMNGTDNNVNQLPEKKFENLERAYPGKIKRLSFGYDRERPINFDAPVWYAQHWTPAEIEELKKRKLI